MNEPEPSGKQKRESVWERMARPERVFTSESDLSVPRALRVLVAYAWRFLVLVAASAVIVWIIIQLKLLVIPLLAAILISALLWPLMEVLLRWKFPRPIAVIVALIVLVSAVGALMTLVVQQIRIEWPEVQRRAIDAWTGLEVYLTEGPLHLSQQQIQEYLQSGLDFLQEQMQTLLSGVLSVGVTLGHLAAGILLGIFILICLLYDGKAIWNWTLKLFPRTAREATDVSARRGWRTVINYAKTQLMVATIDSVGIGLAAYFLDVPLAIPIAVLVFLGAFVPIVGAVLTGALAVVLALIYNDPVNAFWMLFWVIVVQQVEGHVLQPLLMGAAVKVHPMAVVLVVAGGAMIAGIPGALFAVPLAAFVNVVAVNLSTGAWRSGPAPETDLIWQTVPRERRRKVRKK